MADIVPLAVERPPRKARKPNEAAGQVLIFPGIRVEYHDDPPAVPKKRPVPDERQEGPLSA
jgi:hypothetical protein